MRCLVPPRLRAIALLTAGFLTGCQGAGPTETLPRYRGAEEISDRVLYLGDVFDRVNELGELEWDGRPTPGASIKLLLVADGEYECSSRPRAVLRPMERPFGPGRHLDASLGSFRAELKTAHRYVEMEIPSTVEPGFHWIAVTVGKNEFGPVRIEIADPELFESRADAFARADAALAEMYPGTPFLLTGLYAPLDRAALRVALDDDDLADRTWPLFATRLDDDGAVVLDPELPANLLVTVGQTSGIARIHDRFGLASWTLYSFPQKAPRNGYNGWWWKRPGLPAGGTCGTAWCNYPFRGNRVETISNTLAIAIPPVDPYPWWRGQGDGWVCGNGWFHGRRGPGGFGLGPWWPVDDDGAPRPGLGGPMPDDRDDDVETGGGSEPPVTSAPRRPPGLQPPPGPTTCTANYVEAVSKYKYGKPPFGTRVRGSRVGAPPAIYSALPEYEGFLRWARIPSNWTAAGGYEYGWSRPQATQEVDRNRTWWAQYCIDLTSHRIALPDTPQLRAFAQRYNAWIDDLPQPARPEVVMGLSKSMTKRGVKLYEEAQQFYARAAGRTRMRGAIHILFMPRVVARTGHTGNRGRPSEASFTDPALPFVVLNAQDNDDHYILVHELIHALGRPPGKITWDHQSGDPRAMSRVTRRTIRQAAGLGADRLLDYAEYDEILNAGNLRPK